ncbi:MAG: hypothetical protein GX595_15390, partial [Lentisphaerae bacterium]|nr:hypothetical protein [Lentisphaerota bacterium]
EAPVGSARAVAARALTGTDTPELAPTREEMERIVGDVDDAHRTARALACKALADWYAGPGAQPGLAAAYLEKALALRADDRRLVLQLDEVWRTQHDTAHREALWATQPAAWADRGDVTFALARLDLDRGRAAAALDRLIARQFSVVEGGTSVRRLYVDALLVDAVDAFLRGDRALATARCQAVFEYPENLGAAGYLGEHSRLARCLLGLFAAQAGDRKAAETWWKDVLARAGSGVTYTVGGEGMAKAGRLDEQLAILLADRCLHGTALPTPAETAPADHPDGAARALVAAIAAGAPGRARSAEALARWPCDALLRILAQVARLDHTAHHA